MRTDLMATFGPLLTAMASPMRADRSLDLDGAQRLAVHLVEHGSDGIVVAGTTGESPTLTHDETLRLFRAVVEAVGQRATVVAGVGKNDTVATVELAGQAAGCGVDGLLVVNPYYNKPSQRGLAGHFTAVAGATDLPVLLYNIPGRTSVEVAPETLLRLAEDVPMIRGVKDAVGDLAKTGWLAARAPDGFEILSGDDANCLPLLAVGGIGLVSVAAHLVGDDLAAMIEAFPSAPAKARDIHLRLLPLLTGLLAIDTSPGPLKAALDLVGLPGGPVRPPLAGLDAAGAAQLRGALAAAGVAVAGDAR
ncbi:MAG: 4-hydroxy-tetrahydrodipicolinate synthase [Euzebyales bacterium]|jgi:4-hydroxy-tetrahydrodipicolinate synthase|nr:4-hydroxy-tetrahydrodipicolinate synthase [Euzebyales bacterium]